MSKLKRYIQRRGANSGASLAAITPAHPGEWCPAPPLCSTMRTRMTKIRAGDCCHRVGWRSEKLKTSPCGSLLLLLTLTNGGDWASRGDSRRWILGHRGEPFNFSTLNYINCRLQLLPFLLGRQRWGESFNFSTLNYINCRPQLLGGTFRKKFWIEKIFYFFIVTENLNQWYWFLSWWSRW